MTTLEQFKALIAQNENLARDVSDIREVDGDIFYEYDGFITCAVCVDGGEYLDWGDTSEDLVAAWKEGMTSPEGCFYETLEELVAQMAIDADPEVIA